GRDRPLVVCPSALRGLSSPPGAGKESCHEARTEFARGHCLNSGSSTRGPCMNPGSGNGTSGSSGSRKTASLDPQMLTGLKHLLLHRRALMLGDLRDIEKEACARGVEASGDLSALPFHTADLASDAYEQDFSFGLLENKSVEIREMEEALDRIEDGTFGLCETCSEAIPLTRLQAIPYA